jgi:hypothetical protein
MDFHGDRDSGLDVPENFMVLATVRVRKSKPAEEH